MAATGSSDLQVIIEKRVSEVVTETLIQESVSLGVVRDFSSLVGPGMDRLDIPLFAELGVQDVVEGSDLTPSTITPTAAQLDLDRQKAVAWSISKRATVQAKVNAVNEALKNGARSLAAEIDSFIYSRMIVAAGTSGALTANPLDDVLGAKKAMDDANVPKTGRFLTASPGFIQSLLKDNSVINADAYGNANAIQAGFVTRLYGFTIVESSDSSLGDGFVANHMDAFAFARQIQPMLDREVKALGKREDFALDHLYGGVATQSASNRIVEYTA